MRTIRRPPTLAGICLLLLCSAGSLTAQRPIPVGVRRPASVAITTFTGSPAREPLVGDSGGVDRARHAVIGAAVGAVVGAAIGYHRGRAADRSCGSECGGPAGIGIITDTFYFGFMGLALGAIVGYVVSP